MYIFGYGSLINHHSRLLTGQTEGALPATVSGLQRHWGKVNGNYPIAPLVASLGDGQCNGVLVRVDDEGLACFDQRERGYQRVQLDPAQVVTHLGHDVDLPVWVYTQSQLTPPCPLSPIMQTYVDTVLAGCLSISEQFAKEFVETTQGWHYPFENDRHQPKYGNHAGVEADHLAYIDRLVARVRLQK
ncbi:gamma-glutamylcyclotransferase [Photobacterium japonica]|uniref:gamma-glutamylcyclotransferase family protein n=1 Tax=Photobacterium japonica TaxID=2910235 RepID=UPI003D0B4104